MQTCFNVLVWHLDTTSLSGPELQSIEKKKLISLLKIHFLRHKNSQSNLTEYYICYSHGEEWYNVRSTVNGPLMDLESVKQYIPVVNDVANDFIDKIDYLLELSPNKNELPDNFSVEIFKWAFESIAAITLNSRLGIFICLTILNCSKYLRKKLMK